MANKILLSVFILFMFVSGTIWTKTIIVAERNGDFTKIQDALNLAAAGDTILVKEKSEPYSEKITFPRSGNSTDGYIVLMNYPNENPIIDGANYFAGGDSPQGLVRIIDQSYIKVIGFEIRNIIVSDNDIFPSGIWLYGVLNHVEILNNKIHTIQQEANNAGAHGLAVYGTHYSIPISDILIDGNEIYNCKLGWSESLVLNGNVENFIVSNNVVHDNNNIAYDFIGHEGVCPNPELDQARNGLVVDNIAYNIDSRGNQAYGSEANADGFYVDGGKDIIIEGNTVYNCNIGIEIASEHGGKSTSGIIVRNNSIRDNIVFGIALGGYDSERGKINNCKIINNSLYKNNSENFDWGAELLLQYYCNNNLIANNIIYSKSNTPIVNNSTNTGSENEFYNNLYFTEGTAKWNWGHSSYSNFENYKTGSGQEGNSLFEDPMFLDPDNNIGLNQNSPAIDSGKIIGPTIHGQLDYLGNTRIINNKIDIGAVEFSNVTSVETDLSNNNNIFTLFPAYPNPFNPTTNIRYILKEDSNVSLKIYNANGELVRTIFEGIQLRGIHTFVWNGETNKGVAAASGVYLYELATDNYKLADKIILSK